jgi:hypothetical protein
MSALRIAPSSTFPIDRGRPGLRAKTVSTRLSPEELQEVEAAAERDGESLAEWLRELALRSARERPADPIELFLAELMETRCALLNPLHATALVGKKIVGMGIKNKKEPDVADLITSKLRAAPSLVATTRPMAIRRAPSTN